MAVHPLENSAWGFESNCFVCEPKNTGGLRIPFFHDDDAEVVFADYTLEATFSGAPSYVHGGVTLAILDEAMAWATIAIAKSFAMTHTTSTTFHRPMRIGRPYRVEARVKGGAPDGIAVTALVKNGTGKIAAEAQARFVGLNAEQAEAAIGSKVAGDDAGFVRG